MSATAATSDNACIDVLIIDDEPAIRTVLAASLTCAGISHRCADGGKVALQLLTHYRFKLIVTDIHMPDMDGLEVIMHCSAKFPGVRILAISGGGHHKDPALVLRPARALGGKRTLAKPFSGTEFLQVVKEMISGDE